MECFGELFHDKRYKPLINNTITSWFRCKLNIVCLESNLNFFRAAQHSTNADTDTPYTTNHPRITNDKNRQRNNLSDIVSEWTDTWPIHDRYLTGSWSLHHWPMHLPTVSLLRSRLLDVMQRSPQRKFLRGERCVTSKRRLRRRLADSRAIYRSTVGRYIGRGHL